MHGISIRYMQHCQAMLEPGIYEFNHPVFHKKMHSEKKIKGELHCLSIMIVAQVRRLVNAPKKIVLCTFEKGE